MSIGIWSPTAPIPGNGKSVVTTSMFVTVQVAGVACARAAASVRATASSVRIVLCIASPPSGAMALLLRQREDVLLADEVAVLDELGLREVARLAELEGDRQVLAPGGEDGDVGALPADGEGEAVALPPERERQPAVAALEPTARPAQRERALDDDHPSVPGRRQRQGHTARRVEVAAAGQRARRQHLQLALGLPVLLQLRKREHGLLERQRAGVDHALVGPDHR